MDKIQEIDQLAVMRRNEIAELAARGETFPEKIRIADAKATAAAEAGDFEAYRAAAKERDDLKAEDEYIKLRLQKLRGMPNVDPQLVKEAWDDYRNKVDPKMEQKIAEYQRAKRKMLDIYGEMVAIQKEGAGIRQRFSKMIGVDTSESFRAFPSKMIPLRTAADRHGNATGLLSMGGATLKDPDAIFYMSNYVTQKMDEGTGYSVASDRELYLLHGIIGAGQIPD